MADSKMMTSDETGRLHTAHFGHPSVRTRTRTRLFICTMEMATGPKCIRQHIGAAHFSWFLYIFTSVKQRACHRHARRRPWTKRNQIERRQLKTYNNNNNNNNHPHSLFLSSSPHVDRSANFTAGWVGTDKKKSSFKTAQQPSCFQRIQKKKKKPSRLEFSSFPPVNSHFLRIATKKRNH